MPVIVSSAVRSPRSAIKVGCVPPPPELVRLLAELVPKSAFRLVDGVGHLPSVERPGKLAAVIEEFLGEHDLA